MAQRIFLATHELFIVLRWLLSSCGTQALELAHGLSSWATRVCCPITYGILVPWRGIELTFSALEGGFLTTGPPERKSPLSVFCFYLLSSWKSWAVPWSKQGWGVQLAQAGVHAREVGGNLEATGTVFSLLCLGQTSVHACAPCKWNPGFPVSPRSPPIS